MKCLSCDCILNDREATRKSEVTGDFFDLCDPCFSTIEEDIGYDSQEDDEDACVDTAENE